MTLAYYFDGGLAVTSIIMWALSIVGGLILIVSTAAALVRPRWGFYRGQRWAEPEDTYGMLLALGFVLLIAPLIVILILWPFQWDRDGHAADVREAVAAIHDVKSNYRTTVKKVQRFELGYNDTGKILYTTKSGRQCRAKATLQPPNGWVLINVHCALYETGAYPGADPGASP